MRNIILKSGFKTYAEAMAYTKGKKGTMAIEMDLMKTDGSFVVKRL